MATSINEGLLIEFARLSAEKGEDLIRKDIQLVLSDSDTNSYFEFENICYATGAYPGSEAYQDALAEAFISPYYSDAIKEYFAAAHLSNRFILASAGRFLTEKIILSYLENMRFQSLFESCFATIMRCEHLNERIVSAAIKKIEHFDDLRASKILELIHSQLVTPLVVTSWLSRSLQEVQDIRGRGWDHESSATAIVALRVKQIHPEYEGFPDEWVLKVFCG